MSTNVKKRLAQSTPSIQSLEASDVEAAAVADLSQTINGAIVSTGGVVDDDSAASNGTDVIIVPEANGQMAYLESTNAGNANVLFTVGNGGPSVTMFDNDAPGSIILYFDEDATADSRFLCVSPSLTDLFIRCSDGSFLRVAHDASAASNGLAVHIDDDASNTYERLLFISPTDTAGTYTTDDTVGDQFNAAEVQVISDKIDALLAAMRATGTLAA